MQKTLIFIISLIFLMSCSTKVSLNRETWRGNLTPDSLQNIVLEDLKSRPLYSFNEYEIDIYLKWLSQTEENFYDRLRHLAEKNINQPYELYLLGEFPFELYDSQPLYVLNKSDCVVFVEHMYAMALSYDWTSFMKTLMHLRYKNGEISVLTRNHYALYDWKTNNDWLVYDITDSLDVPTNLDTIRYDKQKFFAERYFLETDFPKDSLLFSYIPAENIEQASNFLQTGDLVYVVRGDEKNRWIGHYGLIIVDDDGLVNILHSTPPKVIKQPLMEYVNQSLVTNEKNRKHNELAKIENPKIHAYNVSLDEKKFKFFCKPKSYLIPLPYFYGLKFLRPLEPELLPWEK
ncbi:MAG: DUF1460 domain-containing protein [Candidatus Marinimicrobia bacterium]|nr:DUF1460 domain-containing protein [Candidatus Neomarinimicrobiota bacterium]